MESSLTTLSYKGSSLSIDLQAGGRIVCLTLLSPLSSQPHTIISLHPNTNFTASGSFLMYPWVNRLESDTFGGDIKLIPDYRDGNGVILHGLFSACEREIIEIKENYMVLKVKDYEKAYEKNEFLRKFPKFIEHFILNEHSLSVLTEFLPIDNDDSMSFSYGYHPYIQLDDLEIEGVKMSTNMTHYVKNDAKLLPIYGKEKKYELLDINELFPKDYEIVKTTIFDHCLYNSNDQSYNFFTLSYKSENITITVDDSNEVFLKNKDSVIKGKEKILLKYFQIYTPNDRKRFCIEAQNSGANAYFCNQDDLVDIKKGNPGKYGVWNIFLRK